MLFSRGEPGDLSSFDIETLELTVREGFDVMVLLKEGEVVGQDSVLEVQGQARDSLPGAGLRSGGPGSS